MAHSLITGKLEDLAPISQQLVKLSLEDSTTGGTVSDLPGLFPSLKHLRIETQAVRGRRWSERPQTPQGLATEEELNQLLESDKPEVKTETREERRTEKNETSRGLAMADVEGAAAAEETKDAGGSTVATAKHVRSESDLGGSPSPSPSPSPASPMVASPLASSSVASPTSSVGRTTERRSVIRSLELPGPCPLTHLHLVSTFVQADDVAVDLFRESFGTKIRCVCSPHRHHPPGRRAHVMIVDTLYRPSSTQPDCRTVALPLSYIPGHQQSHVHATPHKHPHAQNMQALDGVSERKRRINPGVHRI